jgi:hypothetical protein
VIDLAGIVEEVASATGARGLSAAVAVGDDVAAHATGNANPERDCVSPPRPSTRPAGVSLLVGVALR